MYYFTLNYISTFDTLEFNQFMWYKLLTYYYHLLAYYSNLLTYYHLLAYYSNLLTYCYHL